tara:strand:+ start:48 stop:215 length:168 start_codon:yes stop_codon:yes gene_type:complete
VTNGFAQCVENSCESDKFEGFEVIYRVVNLEGANGWAIVEAHDHKSSLEMLSALM